MSYEFLNERAVPFIPQKGIFSLDFSCLFKIKRFLCIWVLEWAPHIHLILTIKSTEHEN